MDQFAHSLGSFLLRGTPVIDKTGLKGFYDIRLEYPGMPEPNAVTGVELSASYRKERFQSTILDQLGFKLEPAKAQVEVLFIEHVQKASEN